MRGLVGLFLSFRSWSGSPSRTRPRLRPVTDFISVGEGGLQPRLTLFPNYRPIKLSVDHFAGIAVDEFSKSIPCQGTFTGRIFICVPPARPRHILRHSTQIIPNEGFSVFGRLVPCGTRSIGKQQKEGSENNKASGAHDGLCFSSSQHPLTHPGNIQSSS